tara:strand:+ start:174 stop:839 length:666 start_codon:yes stop_codon:yes gene_type:complete
MGFFSDMFAPSSILSGGITFANDNMMKAAGTQKGDTLFAVNDAMKHGPLETTFDQGSPASFNQLEGDRANRLAADKTGTARGIGDIAALVGAIYGGAALAGGSAGGAAGGSAGGSTAAAPAAGSSFVNPASSNAAFGAANTGSSSMWPQLIKSGMNMMGGSGGQGGGMMGGLMSFGGGQQQQKPQFDTSAWIQKQKDDQNRMLLAQNLKASGAPPEYNDYG